MDSKTNSQQLVKLPELTPLMPFRPKTDREIYAELHPPMDTRNPLAMFAPFDKSREGKAAVEARELARQPVISLQAKPADNTDNLVG